MCCPFVSVPADLLPAQCLIYTHGIIERIVVCPPPPLSMAFIYYTAQKPSLTAVVVLVCSLNYCCNSACCLIVHSLVSHLIIQLCRCITDPPQPPPLYRPRRRRRFRCQWRLLYNSALHFQSEPFSHASSLSLVTNKIIITTSKLILECRISPIFYK